MPFFDMARKGVGRVGRSHVEAEGRSVDLIRGFSQRFSRSGNIDANHVGAVARESLRDRLSNSAGCTRDDRRLPFERLVPVNRGRWGFVQPDHLSVDVRGFPG